MLEQELPKITEIVYRLLVNDNYLVEKGQKTWSEHLGLHRNTQKLINQVQKDIPSVPVETVPRARRKLYEEGSWIPNPKPVFEEYLRVRRTNEPKYRNFFLQKNVLTSEEVDIYG